MKNMKWFNGMLNNPIIKVLLIVIWGIICIIPIVLSIFKSGVDCDSAYYICMAERIAEGYVPYSDLRLAYTPIWFYIEAAIKTMFNIPNGLYWPYLLLFYIFDILTAYFLYRFLIKLVFEVVKHLHIHIYWQILIHLD